jgi:hypothetical protein
LEIILESLLKKIGFCKLPNNVKEIY